jgi:hypothetical protein
VVRPHCQNADRVQLASREPQGPPLVCGRGPTPEVQEYFQVRGSEQPYSKSRLLYVFSCGSRLLKGTSIERKPRGTLKGKSVKDDILMVCFIQTSKTFKA